MRRRVRLNWKRPRYFHPSPTRGGREPGTTCLAEGPVILPGDCTNCGRCIDVCAMDVFRFTHRFDHHTGDLADPDTAPDRRAA